MSETEVTQNLYEMTHDIYYTCLDYDVPLKYLIVIMMSYIAFNTNYSEQVTIYKLGLSTIR